MKSSKATWLNLNAASAIVMLIMAGGLAGFKHKPESSVEASQSANLNIEASMAKLDADPLAYARPNRVMQNFKATIQRSEILRGHRWDHMVSQLERHMMSFAQRYCQVSVRLSPSAVAVLQRSSRELISPCQMSEATAKQLAAIELIASPSVVVAAQAGAPLVGERHVSAVWISSWPQARALDTEAYAQDVVVQLSKLSSAAIVGSKSEALSAQDREHLRVLSQMLNQQMDLYAVLNGRIFEISKNVDALLLTVASADMSEAFDRRREETFLSWRAMWMDAELRQKLELMQALSVSVGSPELIELGRLMNEVNRLVELTTLDQRSLAAESSHARGAELASR